MMRLDEALHNITLLGFETAPFIYFVERHPSYLDVMRAVLHRVESGIITGYSSVVTLTPDALQIAAALHRGCQAFLTNDITLKRVTNVQVLILDEL